MLFRSDLDEHVGHLGSGQFHANLAGLVVEPAGAADLLGPPESFGEGFAGARLLDELLDGSLGGDGGREDVALERVQRIRGGGRDLGATRVFRGTRRLGDEQDGQNG